MDKNTKWVNEQKIERTIKALESNNMNGYYAKDNKELIQKLDELMNEGETVSCGGSMTLFETGVIDYLRSGKYKFLDRYKEGLSSEDIVKIYKAAFTCDDYIASSNAITEDGCIYNVDGNGNRVAALLYGPDRVIIIVGANKIVSNIDEAVKRVKEYTAPANAKRLNKETPCIKTGKCMSCKSKDTICNEYTVIRRQGNKDRIHVIFINEELGY